MINSLATILIATSVIFTGVSSEWLDIDIIERELQPLASKLSDITGYPESEVLYEVFGELNFVLAEKANYG